MSLVTLSTARRPKTILRRRRKKRSKMKKAKMKVKLTQMMNQLKFAGTS